MGEKVDLKLNLNDQAWALLYLLSGRDFSVPEGNTGLISIHTNALYNGRERGVVISADYLCKDVGREVLHVFFAEDRGSDSVVVYRWIGESFFNPPTVNDIPEEAWKNAVRFVPSKIGAAEQHIYDEIDEFLQEKFAEERNRPSKAGDVAGRRKR